MDESEHSDHVVQAVHTSTNLRINIYIYYQNTPEDQAAIVSVEDFSYKYFNSGHHPTLRQKEIIITHQHRSDIYVNLLSIVEHQTVVEFM